MKFWIYATLCGAAALLMGCGSEKIEWKEDVTLDASKTILINRVANFKSASAAGNPFKKEWAPDGGEVSFIINEKRYSYSYKGVVNIFGIFLDENAVPVIVDKAGSRCAKNGFGEYKWVNGVWVLQPEISKALIGRNRNVMLKQPYPGEYFPAHVTAEYRRQADTSLFASWSTVDRASEAFLFEKMAAVNCH